ncbi:MAG: hypothetical protein NTW86_14410 [Candidatus Sumerlaeota bacterium]|nr:hypothetical protein [Candidatus Sumerlaeota bacterium]
MSSPRLRRLQADFDAVSGRFANDGTIRIRSTRGNPPERYEIEFLVRGLELTDDGRIVERGNHVAEINLTSGYPRQAPQCKMLTPIFHPNFDVAAICIGDHWAASESLHDLVVRIAEMIAYQSYNTKSPLNGEAARWADENSSVLPIDTRSFIAPEAELPIVLLAPKPALAKSGRVCANCAAEESDSPLTETSPGVFHCEDCLIPCSACQRPMPLGSEYCLDCQNRLQTLVSVGQTLLLAGDPTGAQRRAEEALAVAPHFADALALKEKALGLRKNAEEVLADASAAYNERRFVRVIELTQQLRSRGFSLARLEKVETRAQAAIAQATQLQNASSIDIRANPKGVIAACKAALEVCSDLPEAKTRQREAEALLAHANNRANLIFSHVRNLAGRQPTRPSDLVALQRMRQDVQELAGILGPEDQRLMAPDVLLDRWKEAVVLAADATRRKTTGYCITMILAWVVGPLGVVCLTWFQSHHGRIIWYLAPIALLEGIWDDVLVASPFFFLCLVLLILPCWVTWKWLRLASLNAQWNAAQQDF